MLVVGHEPCVRPLLLLRIHPFPHLSGIIDLMEYLTQLIGKVVDDTDGERFGKLSEVVVSPGEMLPLVAAYQVKTEDGAFFVPWDSLAVSDDGREFRLNRPVTEIPPCQIHAQDFSLGRDVLDKQIVDVHDYRVVRVNDIRLEKLPNGRLALIGVFGDKQNFVIQFSRESVFANNARLTPLFPARSIYGLPAGTLLDHADYLYTVTRRQ